MKHKYLQSLRETLLLPLEIWCIFPQNNEKAQPTLCSPYALITIGSHSREEQMHDLILQKSTTACI